jgi:Uma2 family endonuclease
MDPDVLFFRQTDRGRIMSTVATFSLEQYDRMVDAGAFDGLLQQHVELIRGEIREMSPVSSPHVQIVTKLTYWSVDVTPRKKILVHGQSLLRISQANSEPEPDVLWVVKKAYGRKHPEPQDVLLLIEVAETSLREDRGVKRDLYAEAMIPDYWIVNIPNQTIEVYREPNGGAYQWSHIFGLGESVSPLALPEAKLEVASLFQD